MDMKPTNEKQKSEEKNTTDRWQYGTQYSIYVMYYNILKWVSFFIKDAIKLKTVNDHS